MIQPPYGRIKSFNNTLSMLPAFPMIVEIGMTRNEDNVESDGFSTILFSWFVSGRGGVLHSIDIDPNAISATIGILKQYEIPATSIYHSIYLTCGDGILFFQDCQRKKIDLLYLDGWDWENGNEESSEKCHLQALKAAKPFLSDHALVLIDDTNIVDSEFIGKGHLIVPYVLKEGWEIVHAEDTQILLRKGRGRNGQRNM